MLAKTIILFNHKGGVSKTLTTFNIAWMLASEMEKKVLLVDCDPQCNLTGLLLGDKFDEYYTSDTTKMYNIKDAVRVAFEGKPEPIRAINCLQAEGNKNLYLIPGHMDLSEYEPALSFAMTGNTSITTLQNLPGAFSELIRLCSERYGIEYVFIDINPGLSAINQIAFTISNAFIVPTNPDPFSLMALKTLTKVLPRWKQWAVQARDLFASASYLLPETEMMFIGEISQRFNRRKGSPTASYQNTIDDIKAYVKDVFVKELQKYNMVYAVADYHLAEIPDFGAMLQKANELAIPVYELNDADLPGGASFENTRQKRDQVREIFIHLASTILELTR